MSILVDARQRLFDMIDLRSNDLESLNDQFEEEHELLAFIVRFELKQAYLPRISLPELAESPRVTLIGLGADQSLSSRGRLHVVDQPVQVCLQAKIDPQDDAEIQMYVILLEQLQECARIASQPGLTWLRNEALKDRSRTPYDFVRLRDAHTFEGVFTAYYRRGTT